jgi:hypothetical protein
MTNETLESMKGPIVVVVLIAVFGLAIAFGQNMTDADKLVGFIVTGLSAFGYISTHQMKSILAAQTKIQPYVSEIVSDLQAATPEATSIISKLKAGQAPSAAEVAALYPDVEELIRDLQKLVPAATAAAVEGTEGAKTA